MLTKSTEELFETLHAHPRVLAWALARKAEPDLALRFDRIESGEHVFVSASGAEVWVDLVIRRVRRVG